MMGTCVVPAPHGLGLGLGPPTPPREHGQGDADRGPDSPQALPLAGHPSARVKQRPRAGEAARRPQVNRSPAGIEGIGRKADLPAEGEEAYSFHRTNERGYACH